MQTLTPTHLLLFIFTLSFIGFVFGIIAYFKVPKVDNSNEGNSLNDAYLYEVWGIEDEIYND